MTYAQGLRLTTRAISIYLLCWAITDLIEIPREVFNVSTSIKMAHATHDTAFAVVTKDFYLSASMQWLAQSVLRVALWSAASLWFYRCGPRVRSFFGLEEASHE